ncbi:MAG: tyrosine-type recombinase/integrase [Betaproteobacteria bacterium]|nr:tyrosine-type recombinase/integrase [Betaproteobacteria bacterium]
MLRELFPRSGEKYLRSRFGHELQEFCGWLDAAGYSKLNIRHHLRRAFKVFAHSRKLGADKARSRQSLHQAFGRYCTCVRLSQDFRGTEHAYARFLSSRGRLLEASSNKSPASLLCGPYQQYLADVRGFCKTTVGQHQSTVSEFLRYALRGGCEIATLTSAHVEHYLAKRSNRLSRQSMQHVIAHLRGFLRYAYAKGLIRERLEAIDTPRTYRDELPPRALPWSLVKKLLRSVDRSSKAGWRDFMILHLMAYYGLRPSEIAALRVDAIDWDAKTCRVEQRKTRSDLILPLSDRTLELLQQYLHRGRPEAVLPQLFLRVRRPAGALRNYAVCEVFYKRAVQSGLPLDGYSPYCLRHSFAMRLLQRGVGVKAIGDLLGHRSLEATCVYLRLDTSALRAVALPVPRARSSLSARHA